MSTEIIRPPPTPTLFPYTTLFRSASIRLVGRRTTATLALRVPGQVKCLHLGEHGGWKHEDKNRDSKDHSQWPHGLAPSGRFEKHPKEWQLSCRRPRRASASGHARSRRGAPCGAWRAAG